MRTRSLPTLAIALTTALGACVSAPVASGPAPVTPMRLTIVRPEYDKVLVQTNRYAYVALFEILPDRGVAIVYPATAHQASESVAGNHWLPVSLQSNQPTYRGFPPRRVVRDHYLYAIASDVPFHISDGDYDPATLSRELGDDAYWGHNIAGTMRALAREFGPALPAQDWAEDSYALEEAQETPVVRVYCGDGEAIEVRETIVARINCSSRAPAVYGTTGSNGSSGRSGGYVPPRNGPDPVANNPATAPTPTPPHNAPWAPFPHRDSVTQAGTPRGDSIRRPPVLRFPGGTSTASDSSAHGGQTGGSQSGGSQSGGAQTDDHHGRGNGNANGQGDDDHRGHGDNGRGNGGVPGNGGVNAGNGNGQGNNGSHGNGNSGSSNAGDNSQGNSNGQGQNHGNGSDNGRGNGGVPGNGGVNAGNGNGASNGNASNGHGNGNGNAGDNGNSHSNATPGIGDANPHGNAPTVNGATPMRMPFGIRVPPSSKPTTQPAPAQQPSSDSAKPAPARRMSPVKQAADSSDKKPKLQQ